MSRAQVSLQSTQEVGTPSVPRAGSRRDVGDRALVEIDLYSASASETSEKEAVS